MEDRPSGQTVRRIGERSSTGKLLKNVEPKKSRVPPMLTIVDMKMFFSACGRRAAL